MATEKILIFDESGNAKRMKVRIARFLDNEPVTATDKENIRTTLDVDGSQSGTFTTNLTTTQKLGAGTSSPSAPLSVESSSLPKATFGYGGSSAEHQLAWDSSKFNIAADAGNAVANSEIGFFVDGSKRFAINASGNLVVSSGGAIDFGSTTGGTGTVATNGGLLDDYEFGTFAVTTNGDATGVLAGQYGEYTKIGRLVNVRIVFNVSTNFTDNRIGGLPFTVNSQGVGASSVWAGGLVFTGSATDSPVTCFATRSATHITFLSGTRVGDYHSPNTTDYTYRLQFSYHTDD